MARAHARSPRKPTKARDRESADQKKRVVCWPLKAFIFSDAELYRYALREFAEHFHCGACDGHPPYRMILSQNRRKQYLLSDCRITIEDASDPLDRPVKKAAIWELAPSYWRGIAAYFDDLVFNGRVALVGRWNSFGAQLAPIASDVFPFSLADAVERGDLDIETGVLRMPNGETVYSIQFEPPAELLRDNGEASSRSSEAARSKRGRPPLADRGLIIEHGLKIMRERGHFAGNDLNWDCPAKLQRALLEFVQAQEIERSESSIRKDAKEIIEIFERDG